jgi:UDP-N-acetylglucosamine--N-acetylmuramyl-(pentapeptide) pyrophosphoryl-undecaprenol N-acetylglucosamine transferase
MAKLNRVMISGGGTGGHIHPALAIAEEIRRRYPECVVRFVGAKGRMEMEKVPAAGYPIDGLWISGVDRSLRSARNWVFPLKLASSLWKARGLLRAHRPEVVVGVGGFASGPLLDRAARRGLPTLIQEQNSYPGVTNRLLAKRVDRICAGFPGLERWFPAERIVETGNPLRASVVQAMSGEVAVGEARQRLGLEVDRPVLFVMGGSLGAASMNAAVRKWVESGAERPQILWQCGARYFEEERKWAEGREGLVCVGFIDRMEDAYAAATVVASRAGAMSIAELALVGKPAVLVPSPVVAEDHQTRNARSLTDRGGALLLEDRRVVDELPRMVMGLLADPGRCAAMGDVLKEVARPEAASRVVDELERLVG